MTELTKGIIEINGFTFHPGTTKDEVLAYFGEKVYILELPTGPKVKFLSKYYIAEDLYAYAFNFSKEGVLKNFSLIPEAPSSVKDCGYGEIPKAKLAIAKRWLKSVIETDPHTLLDSSVYYKFDSVDYYASVETDRDYCLVGGEIVITFHGV